MVIRSSTSRRVDLAAGSDLIVYAVGSLDDQTVTFYTQTISGLGGAPTLVNTGDSVPSTNSIVPLLLITLAGLLAVGASVQLVVLRWRRH